LAGQLRTAVLRFDLGGWVCATHVGLMNFTSDGIESIKDHPKRRDEARKAAEGMGLKIHGVCH
jgi:uncharacterized protein with GYD domain